MPKNKKESFIYTMMMCAFMVFFMSVYNVSRVRGFSLESIKESCFGFPIAYLVGICCDWFLVSRPAKAFAFRLVGMQAAGWKKIIAISGSMVCGMVVLMSFYGAVEAVGLSNMTIPVWLTNIPYNLIVALPLQLLVAGPVIRYLFRIVIPLETVVIEN